MTETPHENPAESGSPVPALDDKLVVFMVDESQDAYERLRDLLAIYSKEIMREVILIQAPNTIDMWEKYLRYKQEYPIDVVLMDYRLPMVQLTAQGTPQYVTGVTCIRQLREEGGYTGPIVGFAADREENVNMARDVGTLLLDVVEKDPAPVLEYLKANISDFVLLGKDVKVRCNQYLIDGNVHSLGYLEYAQRMAHRIGIKGFSQNADDLKIRVLGIGTASELSRFEGFLLQGPAGTKVKRMHVQKNVKVDLAQFPTFEVR